MKAKVVSVGLVAVGLLGVWVVWQEVVGTWRLAGLAPAEVVVWVEAPDLRGAVEALQRSEAWGDVEGSATYAEFEGWWRWAGAQATAEGRLLGRLGLPLDRRTALRFVGQGVAAGVWAPAAGEAALVVMARVDVVGLARDLAVQGDWGALRDALGGRDREEAEVVVVEGVQVSRWESAGRVHCVALVGDVVVWSPSLAAITAVIEVERGVAPSLAAAERFRAEAEALGVPQAYLWLDTAWAQDTARMERGVSEVAAGVGVEAERARRVLRGWASELREGAPSLAVGLYVPGGDPYRVRVEASRGEEAWFEAGAAGGRARPEEARWWVEVSGGETAWRRWREGSGWEALRGLEVWRWAAERLREPAWTGRRWDPTFEVRCALRALEGGVAWAARHRVEVWEDAEGWAVAVRAPAVTRGVLRVVDGWLRHDGSGLGEARGVVWGQRGGWWVVGERAEAVEAALARVERPAAAGRDVLARGGWEGGSWSVEVEEDGVVVEASGVGPVGSGVVWRPEGAWAWGSAEGDWSAWAAALEEPARAWGWRRLGAWLGEVAELGASGWVCAGVWGQPVRGGRVAAPRVVVWAEVPEGTEGVWTAWGWRPSAEWVGETVEWRSERRGAWVGWSTRGGVGEPPRAGGAVLGEVEVEWVGAAEQLRVCAEGVAVEWAPVPARLEEPEAPAYPAAARAPDELEAWARSWEAYQAERVEVARAREAWRASESAEVVAALEEVALSVGGLGRLRGRRVTGEEGWSGRWRWRVGSLP